MVGFLELPKNQQNNKMPEVYRPIDYDDSNFDSIVEYLFKWYGYYLCLSGYYHTGGKWYRNGMRLYLLGTDVFNRLWDHFYQ